MTDQDQQPVPSEPSTSGPFADPGVDRLVYRQSNEAPEARAAHMYRPIVARQPLTTPAPQPPQPQQFTPWTPGQDSAPPAPPAAPQAKRPPRSLMRIILTVTAVAGPLAIIAAALWFGYTLTQAG